MSLTAMNNPSQTPSRKCTTITVIMEKHEKKKIEKTFKLSMGPKIITPK